MKNSLKEFKNRFGLEKEIINQKKTLSYRVAVKINDTCIAT